MNWFDLAIIVLLFIAFIKGYKKGLINQLVLLASIVLAAIFGGSLAAKILPWINDTLNLSPAISGVLSFVIAFGAISAVISLAGTLLQKLINVIFLSFFNRILGSIVAVATMMVFLSIVLNLVLMLDTKGSIIKEEIKEDSFFFERVEAVVPAIVPYLNKEFLEDYIPENYRKEIESKSDSIFRSLPDKIDSTFQQQHFNVN